MTAEMKKLKDEVKTLKREVKQLRGLVTKVSNQLERVAIVASTASSSATETKKKLSALMRDPAVQVPQKLERKVEALNRAHANTAAKVSFVQRDLSKLGDAVHTVNKDFRDDTLKSLRGFEARLDALEGDDPTDILQLPPVTPEDVAAFNAAESIIKASGVDANGSPVEEPKQMDLEEAIAKIEPVVAS